MHSCGTHHHACSCREAKFREMEAKLVRAYDDYKKLNDASVETALKLARAEQEIERMNRNLEAVKKAYFCDQNKTSAFCACQHSCFVRWQVNNVMRGKTTGGDAAAEKEQI